MRKKAIRLLLRLRTDGPVTKTDLLQRFHLKKEERDALLTHLTEENLIRVDGKVVTAMPYREFVERLYASAEFPEAGNLWEATRA